MDIIRFVIPEFVAENLKANKTSKKDHSFCNTVSLKKPHSFYVSQLFWNWSHKSFSVYKLSSKHVSIWCQKKHLRCTIFWRLRTTFLKHFESKYLYISVYLYKKFLFQRRIKILSGGMGRLGRLNNFLKAACCLGLVKCFTIFHFNWNFLKLNYFSVFRYFHQ